MKQTSLKKIGIRFWGKMVVVLSLIAIVALSACNSPLNTDAGNSSAAGDGGDGTKMTAEDIQNLPTEFADPFVDGSLNYSVQSCGVYQNLTDAGIELESLEEPHSIYMLEEDAEQYEKLGDYVGDDGSIDTSHELVMLEMTVQNVDADGIEKENEFNVYNLILIGGQTASEYCVSYFDKAGLANEEQPMHYELKKGETMQIRLGYFVLKEDLENIYGKVSGNELQFRVTD